MSKRDIYELIKFVESQIIFTIESTSNINHYEQFLDSMGAKVLFNSTCMCLQSIGETIKQIDDRTDKKLLMISIMVNMMLLLTNSVTL